MFTAQDTYRGDGIDTSQWDLYAYCDGDPVNATDPTGHVKKTVVFAYYNKKSKRNLLNQAKNSPYYCEESATIYRIPTRKKMIKRWNEMPKNVESVYLYFHGAVKRLTFLKGIDLSIGRIKKKFKKKANVKRVYLFSCHGAKGGRKSVAYALKTTVNENADVFASYDTVSFRMSKSWQKNTYNYIPRYSEDYIKMHGNNYAYYYINPVRKITEW